MDRETVVVLGAAVWPGGVPSPTLRRRTEWACELFNAARHDLLVFSGAIGKNPPSEADVMAAIARSMDISQAVILLDREARTTLATAAFAASMPDAAVRQFIAVTDIYHAPRTWLAFRAYRLHVGLSCPPMGRNTRFLKLLASFMRKTPAMGLYMLHFLRLRLARR